MSIPQQEARQASTYAPPPDRERPRHWVAGLSLFAGVLMIITGLFGALEGLVALFRNQVYLVGFEYVFSFDLTTWGWVHLVIGIVVAAVGAGVVSGRTWGRIAGIAIVIISMVTNFLFIPHYPVWSLLIITLDVFVIWALCVVDRRPAAV